jgi:hypothetical protein
LLSDYTFTYNDPATQTPGGGLKGSPTANVWSQLNGGTSSYTVQVKQISTDCSSTLSSILVGNTPNPFSITTSAVGSTNCTPALANGSVSVTQVDGSPAVAAGFVYAWTGPSSPAFPVTAGTNNANTKDLILVQGGTGYNYTVVVTRQADGCQLNKAVNVPDSKQVPVLTLIAQPNTICDPSKTNPAVPFDGQVSANVNLAGNYATSVAGDFNFTWTGLPASSGVGQNILLHQDVGTYSVTAQHVASGCTSVLTSANVTSAKTLPSITMDQTPSTNCVGGTPDGIAKVLDVLPHGKNYDYKWYDGNSTSGAAGPTTLNTTATTNNYTGVQGGVSGASLIQYTVEVTILQTGCLNTASVGVADNKSAPVLGALVETDNTVCSGTPNGTASVNTALATAVVYKAVNQPSPYAGFTFAWTGPSGFTGSGASISSLAAGTYSLTTKHVASNCISNPVTVTVKDNLFIPKIDIVSVDQTSCDTSAPNGKATATIDETAIAGGTGVTAGYSFTWTDLVTSSTISPGSNAITGLKGNQSYKIDVTRTSTGCTNSQTIFLNETLTVPTVTTAVTDLTTCAPVNGKIVATPAPGAVGSYDFFWYDGNNAANENAVIAVNNTGLVGVVSTNTYDQLIPGDYTVVVRDKTTKCVSVQTISTVNNNAPAINPEAENTIIPAFCNATGGELTAGVHLKPLRNFTADAATDALTIPTSIGLAVNDKVFISRNGSLAMPGGVLEDQTYFVESIAGGGTIITLKDAGGTHVDITSNGDGTITDFVTAGYTFNWYSGVPTGTNPSNPINYFTNPPVFTPPASAGSVFPNIKDGLYSVEVTDNATGCKNFVSHTLPFIGSHAVIKITKTNSQFCSPSPDNGSITIRIEDPATGGPFVPDNYTVTLKQGATVIVTNALVQPFPAADLTLSSALAPGSYVVNVKQNYGSGCALDQDVIIGRDAMAPVISLVGAITNNDACDLSVANGAITVNVDKDATDLVAGQTYNITMAPSSAPFPLAGVAAGNQTASNLAPGTYSFTATSNTGCTASKSFTVLNTPVYSQIAAGDLAPTDAQYCVRNLEQSAKVTFNQLKLVNGGVENMADYRFDWTNVATSTVVYTATGDAANNGSGGDEFINITTVPAGTVWVGSYSVTATKLTDVSGSGGIGCKSAPFTVTIADKSVNPQITLTPSGNTSCSATFFEGSIRVDVKTLSGPGAGAATYGYAWNPTGGPGQPTNSASGNTGSADMFNNLVDGSYTLTATSDVTGCANSLGTTITRATPPVFTVSASVANQTNCGTFDGKIDNLQVFVNGAAGTVSDFDYVWFRSDLTTKVLDGQNVAVPDDIELTLTTYPAIGLDKYFVKSVRKAGGAGFGCESPALRKDILDDRVYPQVTFTSTPNSACDTNYDGQIVATTNTSGFGAGTLYGFAWTIPVAPMGSNITAQAAIAAGGTGDAVFTTVMATDRIGEGTYSVVVTNQSNSCTVTGSVNIISKTIPMSTTVISTDLTVCAPMGTNGTGTVTAITELPGPGNTANYTYTWATDAAMTATFGVLNDPLTTRNGLGAGTYYVTAKRNAVAPPVTAGINGSGCVTAPSSITILDKHEDPVVSFSALSNTACDTNYDGQIVATANTNGFGAGTLYDFTWTVPVAPAGSNITAQAAIAAGGTGDAVFTTVMATDRIGDGTYSVVVTNQSNSCKVTGTVNVTKKTIPMSTTVSSTDLTVCAPMGTNGTGTVTAITEVPGPGNTANYTYTWATDAAMTATFGVLNDPLTTRNGLGAGTYYVTAKRNAVAPPVTAGINGSGCVTAPSSITILDKHEDPVVSFSALSNTACDTNYDGQIVATANTNGFGAGTLYDFAWTVPVAPAGSNITAQAAIAAGGTGDAVFTTVMATDRIGDGTYSVVVTNQSNSCKVTGTVNVTKKTIPMSTTVSSTDLTVCAPMGTNGTGTVTSITEVPGPGNTANYTYTWATDAAMTATFGVVNDPLTTRNGLGAGTYYVTAKRNAVAPPVTAGINGSGCVTAPSSITILDKHEDPVVSFSALSNTACDTNYDGQIVATANTNGFGAGTLYDFTWTVPVAPAGSNITAQAAIAAGGTGDAVFTTVMATDRIGDGTYSVVVTNQSNSCKVTGTVNVTKKTIPMSTTVSSTDLTVCAPMGTNGTGTVTAITEVPGPGNTANYTYTWATDAAMTATFGVLNDPLTTRNGLGAGTYYVTAKRNAVAPPVTAGINGSGCVTAPSSITILDKHEDPVVSFSALSNTACDTNYDGQIVATANTNGFGAGTLYDFTWTVPVAPAGSNITAQAAIAAGGTGDAVFTTVMATDRIGDGTYSVVVTNQSNSCKVTGTVNVTKKTIPMSATVSSTDLTVCAPMGTNGTGTVTAITEVPGPGNTANYTYTWATDAAMTATFGVLNDPLTTRNGLGAGTYYVTAKRNAVTPPVTAGINGSGCVTAPSSITILDKHEDPVVSFSALSNTACDTNYDGQIVATANTNGFGAGTLYDFAWTVPVAPAGSNITAQAAIAAGGTGDAVFTTVMATDRIGDGTYSVVVTNQSNSCKVTGTVNVTKKTIPMSTTVSSTDLTVCAPMGTNGTGTVTSITEVPGPGNTANYTYTWATDAAMTATFGVVNDPLTTRNGLGAGTYYVTAKRNAVAPPVTAGINGSGCVTAPSSITILDKHEDPVVSFSALSNTACDTNYDGQIVATANTNGFGAGTLYDFTWTVPVAPAGSNITAQAAIAAGGTGDAVFTTVMATDRIGDGTYSVVVTNQSNSCKVTGTVNVTKKTIPMSTTVSSTDLTVCAPMGTNGTGTVTAITEVPGPGNTANYTYTWATDAAMTATFGVLNDPLTTRNGLGAGTYYVTAKRNAVAPPVTAGINGSGCVTAPSSITILDKHVNPTIAAATVNPDTNCAGGSGVGSITINEPTPLNFTYSWFTGDDVSGTPVTTTAGVNGEVAQLLQEGDYTVQVMDNANSCLSVKSFTVANSPTLVSISPAGFSSPAITTCNLATGIPSNGSATITSIIENSTNQPVPGNYIFTWTDASNNVLQSSAATTLNNLVAGSYFVTAVNSATNCSTDFEFKIDDQTIGSTQVTLIDFESPERCVNPVTGSLTVQGSGNGASYSYEWYTGDQRPTPAGAPIATTDVLGGITTTSTYTIKVINNTNNCWAVDAYSVPLIVNPIIISASTSPLTYCSSDNGEAFATTVNDNKFDYDFYWGTGTAVNPAAPNYTGNDVTGLTAGTYTVVAIDKLDAGCVSPTATVVIENLQVTPVVSTNILKNLTFCDPAKPDGEASANVGGDVIHYFFDWYTGSPIPAGATPFYRGDQVGGLTSTTYTVQATDKITGCSATASIDIPKDFQKVPNPTVEVVSDVTNCIKDNGILSASVNGVTKDYIFDWANGSNPPPPIDFTGEIYSGLGIGKYTVIATSRITGCVSAPVTTPVNDKKVYPEIEFLVQSATCDKNNGYITLLVNNNLSIATVTWYKEGAKVDEGPNLHDAMSGTYSVKVVTNLGCETEKNVFLPADILAYNGVSRNGDGNNDFFLIDCIQNFPNNHVEIFNRAGTKVYEADGYDNSNVLFDGNSNKGISLMGTHLPPGTYFYVISKGDGSKSTVGYLELVD